MSSDSSDEENLDLLREAVDSQFINDSMFNKKTTGTDQIEYNNPNSKNTVESQPSLRRNNTDEDEQFNFCRVTPEFRNYIAKLLSKTLEEKLQKQLKEKKNKNDKIETETVNIKKSKRGGVRLFKNSKKFVKANNLTLNNIEVPNINKHNKATNIKWINNLYNKSKTDVSEQDLKNICVNPEDIISKKEVKYWSNRSKAPVLHYKQLKTGELVEIQDQ